MISMHEIVVHMYCPIMNTFAQINFVTEPMLCLLEALENGTIVLLLPIV